MASTTTNHNLPYPEGTDPVNIPSDIQNLAEAIDALDFLPSQTSNSGKFLTTDGTSAAWDSVDALPSQTGNNGKYLTTSGTSASWSSISHIDATNAIVDLTASEVFVLSADDLDSPTILASIDVNGSLSSPYIKTKIENTLTNEYSQVYSLKSQVSLFTTDTDTSQVGQVNVWSNGNAEIKGSSQTSVGQTGSSTLINGSSFTINGDIKELGLPVQTSNSGKYLTTNGTSASWSTISQIPSQTGNNGKYLTTDGSTASWGSISAPGLVLITSQSFTSQTAVNIDNCFTSTYENYFIQFNLDGSTGQDILFRLRASGTDNSTSNYAGVSQDYAGNYVSTTTTPVSTMTIGVVHSSGEPTCSGTINVFMPFLSKITVMNSNTVGAKNTRTYICPMWSGWKFGLTNSFDGFTIYPNTGTVTGTLYVYGYKK